MSEPIVQLLEIELKGNNPDMYTNQLNWKMRLEASEMLSEPISITFVWVGSASSPAFDQTLDSFDVGPLERGQTEIDLECDPPQLELVPPGDALGVTILIISFQYRSQEFLRVGYYAQVAYFDNHLNEMPPEIPHKELLGRFIAMPQPVVTVTPIEWYA
ncbi:unnamed protein product [Phytomonas sp. Hart1]|nr:unnamed protein product [Phytomonas sp. Hart1]|eukprot:CCW67245.1 unnamed protein product [Phytomonas sp. isolate Hart1]